MTLSSVFSIHPEFNLSLIALTSTSSSGEKALHRTPFTRHAVPFAQHSTTTAACYTESS